MNHQLITEVAKTTAATLVLLASSPSRLTDLKVEGLERWHGDRVVEAEPREWRHRAISSHTARRSKPDAHQLRVTKPTAVLPNVAPGVVIAVKAVNAKGFEGWDWARVTVK